MVGRSDPGHASLAAAAVPEPVDQAGREIGRMVQRGIDRPSLAATQGRLRLTDLRVESVRFRRVGPGGKPPPRAEAERLVADWPGRP
jgi:hypothetical protein